MIEKINNEILCLIKHKLEEYFSYEDIFGISVMKLGRQNPFYLNLLSEIKQIVIKHTSNNDILSNIPVEIEIAANTLVDGMVNSGIYEKLSKKDIKYFMFETIKNYIENSEYLFNEFQKDKILFRVV